MSDRRPHRLFEFDCASRRMLCDDRAPEQWSEAEQHAMAIVRALAVTLSGGPATDALPRLRAARKALGGSDAVRWRTYYAARAVTEWAERWRLPESQESRESRAWVLEGLVHELALHDDAFEALAAQHELLASKLDAFDHEPAGKRGRKGSVRILAELIVEVELDALGVVDDLNEVEAPTVNDVRDKLERLIARCRAQREG